MQKGKIRPNPIRQQVVFYIGNLSYWGFGELGHTVCREKPKFGLIPLYFFVLLVLAKRKKEASLEVQGIKVRKLF